MNNGQRSAQIVRFGLFEADLQTGELRKNGVKVPLQGQPFQVCAILLSRSGELVSREELRQQVWPEDTFVDFDHGLNIAITKIRVALGDRADTPRFVETLPRRGYRFIGPVDKSDSPTTAPPPPPKPLKGLTTKARWISGVALSLAVLVAIGIWRLGGNRADAGLPPLEVVPIAALPGFESDPAFSPDGNQVAFAFGAKDRNGIYTVMVDGDKALRLTSNAGDAFPTWSPDGRRIAFYRFSVQLRDTLREQSIRDPLTRLFNRRFLEESLERELQVASRKKQAVAVLFLDLDHFKRFNDTFGHDAGDMVLQALADLFRAFFRSTDMCCRYGGEEFAVILPESSSRDAAIRADALRSEVKNLRLQYKKQTLGPLTLSAGVAAFPEHGSTSDELLKIADQSLYESKSRGRDVVTVAEQQNA